MGLKKQLTKVIDGYIKKFETKHECYFDGFINDDIIGIVVFADSYFNMSDIILDLDNKCPKDMIFKWYDKTLDAGMEGKKTMNYKSWVMGLRYEDINK